MIINVSSFEFLERKYRISKNNKMMGKICILLAVIHLELASGQFNKDYTWLEDSLCPDYDWLCAAVDGVSFGMMAVKLVLALVTISCCVTWVCMLGIVCWLFVKKRN